MSKRPVRVQMLLDAGGLRCLARQAMHAARREKSKNNLQLVQKHVKSARRNHHLYIKYLIYIANYHRS